MFRVRVRGFGRENQSVTVLTGHLALPQPIINLSRMPGLGLGLGLGVTNQLSILIKFSATSYLPGVTVYVFVMRV